MNDENPFERYGLDPAAGPKAITARLRELAEDTDDEHERAEIRQAWEALTMHPWRRLDLALQAHPESRSAADRPPRPSLAGAVDLPSLAELVALPSLVELAGLDSVELSDRPLSEDPILTAGTQGAGRSHPPDPQR